MNHKERNLKKRKAQIVYLWLRDSSQPTAMLNSFSHGAEENERLCNHFLLLEESLTVKRTSKKKENRCLSTIVNKLVVCYNTVTGLSVVKFLKCLFYK